MQMDKVGVRHHLNLSLRLNGEQGRDIHRDENDEALE
jgi:hypothetical protein